MKNEFQAKIREIPNWPVKSVNFKDITPLLSDKKNFRKVIDAMSRPYLNQKIDKVVGIDARGFLLASAMAYKLNCGLVIVRKKGKLPWKTISKKYALEYGNNIIEMHKDAVKQGEKILIVDDVLATGGTMKATVDLVKKLKGKIIGIEFLIDLSFLPGRKVLEKTKGIKGAKINSLINYYD